MNETFEYLKSFAQFPFALRAYLRSGLTVDRAQDIVRRRLDEREDRFVAMAERSIYSHSPSPYLALLKLADCELGDLRQLVKQRGLEGALRSLREAGVYITFEEYKGRKPVVRHGKTIPVKPGDFDNPAARRDFALTTGGSTGVPTAVFQDLDHIAAGAPHHMLMLDAWGVLNSPVVQWMHTLPGGGLRFILQRAYFERYPERWFAPNPWRDSRYWLKYAGATLYMTFWMRVLGVNVSLPQVVTMDKAHLITQCVRHLLDVHGRCLLYTSVSRGLRVCLAAEKDGTSLAGTTIRVGGEPVTAAKAEAMRRSGARVLPAYGGIDTGSIGLGCADPDETDEVHLCKDAFAVITQPYSADGGGTAVPAFNLTSLLDTSSKVMLNYQSDDYGILRERSCGCPLDGLGFTTHLHGIRSYSKLVGEAVTLVGEEMQRIIEHHLPARFGGGPLDYQLMEEEDSTGLTKLALIIDPSVNITDERRVVEFVMNALTESSPAGDSARRVWQQTQTLQVRRMPPVLTARGKLLPLHLHKPGGSNRDI